MYTVKSWYEKGQYFTHQNQHTFYVDEGQGTPILLLHGYPTASYDWQWIWDRLRPGHRLIAPDFLGFGFSDKPTGYPYSINNQTDRIVALLAELGVKQFHLVAHDYAVSVAQELIARIKNLETEIEIKSVCLLNGGLFPELHRPVLMQKLLISSLGPLIGKLFNKKRFAKSFGQVFGATSKPSNDEMDSFWNLIQYNNGQRIIHKLLHYIADRKANRNRWVDAIIDPPMPVLLINGLQDPVSGKHLVEGYKQMVKNPIVVEIPNAGHYPQVEQPDIVVQAIKGWVKG